jgi:hypothetical protein
MRPVWLPFVFALALVPRAAWPQGTPLGPEFRANAYTTGSQTSPALATNIAGDFTVVWESPQDGSGNGIFGQRIAAGVPVGPEFLVNTFTTGDQLAPSAGAGIVGDVMVVWASGLQDGSGLGIFGQRYASNGLPSGPEFRVNTFTTSDQFDPAVAVDKSGVTLVVWASDGQDGSGLGVFAQRFTGSGFPLGTEFRLNTETAFDQRAPAVAATLSGNFVIAWESSDGQDGSGTGVFGQRYSTAGFPVGAEFRVNSFTPGAQLAPAVSATFNSFVVAWQGDGQDGSGYGVLAQRFANDGAAAGPEFVVNTFVTGGQSAPAIADGVGGEFVVVWESAGQDGDAAGIFGQRYANGGAVLGPEFRVNTFTPGPQRRPAAAASFAGHFTVVWESEGQDGSGYGVFGQRYSQIVPVEVMGFRVE